MPTVKVEVTTPGINQVIRNSDCNIQIECRRIYELRRFININLWRRWVLSWVWQHVGRRWWYICLSHDIWRRWRRCGYYGLRRRGYHTRAGSRHLIPIGIHALDIGIIISALGLHAIDPA
jgi:hypothetical protein